MTPLTTPLSKRRSDEGYSASRDLEKREAYRDLLADAISKEHPYDDAIIVHKLGRFWRNSAEAATTKVILKRHSVGLISVQEPVVGSDSPEDGFMEHILVAMAEFYSLKSFPRDP